MRVVVVDDDADIRLMLQAMLAGRHDVSTFPSVADARAHDWSKVDVAIIDVTMPREDGGVLLEWLAVHHPDVRRIVCTAKPVDHLDSDRFEAAHDLVEKPFTLDALEAAIG